MVKVLVGSMNPVKIAAVKEAFLKYFPTVVVFGLAVDSGVPAQPIGDQTFDEAKNRALALRKLDFEKVQQADFFVGIEGGVFQRLSTWFDAGVMCIIDSKGRIGYGTSPYFEIPHGVARQLLAGKELGTVMDEMTGKTNIKHKEGAIGFFTHGVMDRKELYIQGLIVALVPFINEAIYFPDTASKKRNL